MSRRLISTGSPFEKTAGYSRAVIDGDFAFVAGTTGYDYCTVLLRMQIIGTGELSKAKAKVVSGGCSTGIFVVSSGRCRIVPHSGVLAATDRSFTAAFFGTVV